jgi:glycosyltransferase involved in cell wall biosynthesis
MSRSLALGVTVFKRTNKLRALLESVPPAVKRVYVADDGDTRERESIYDVKYGFDLEVIDLEYDAGLGRGRQAITDRLSEEYLIVVDSDQLVPDNVELLVDQLEEDASLGGVAGLFLEHGTLTGMCHDIYEDGDLLIRDTERHKTVRTVAGAPLIEFDFVPNAVVFRKSCLDDHTWDPQYRIGKEHLDFYVGHYRATDWTFAVSPQVFFPHEPGGDADFMTTRHDPTRLLGSKAYFLDKWGYRQILRKRYWLDHAHGFPTMMQLANLTPRPLQPAVLDLNEILWRIQGKLYDSIGRLVNRTP